VVRHELWPAFLIEARRHSRTIVIDATAITMPTGLKLIWKRWLLQFVDFVAAVSDADSNILQQIARAERVLLLGDTKYDRVIERSNSRQEALTINSQLFNEKFGTKRRLIVGSAWPQDVAAALQAYRHVLKENPFDWQLIIAPHQTTESMYAHIEMACVGAGLQSMRWSKRQVWAPEVSGAKTLPVVIIDSQGLLAEIYSVAELCLMGGAFHHRVHNVLEPALYGLHLCFGPQHTTSREALLLAEKHLAQVVANATELSAWWRNHLLAPPGRNQAMIQWVQSQAGAAERLCKVLAQLASKE